MILYCDIAEYGIVNKRAKSDSFFIISLFFQLFDSPEELLVNDAGFHKNP
jgi:hypothetical protein